MSIEMTHSNETFSGPWLMLAEIQHRIVNEYTQAIGFISTKAMLSHSPDVKDTLNCAALRLMNYAEVHRALQAELSNDLIDLSQYLRRLCEALSEASLVERGIRITIVERLVELEARRCWRVGLIVAELITNSARHAFAQGGGSITIELTAKETQVLCCVSDDGQGSCDSKPGRGRHIIDAIAYELGGRLTRERSNLGTATLLTIPRRQDTQHVLSGQAPAALRLLAEVRRGA
jgi:two-component sensor histidine kinase